MAENFIPAPVVTFTNDTTAVNTVNNNFNSLATVLADVLSRSGVTPNQMGSTLDMNSNQIINLPPPATNNSPARIADVVSNPSLSIPPVGTSGAVVGLLNGNNTYSGTSSFTGAVNCSSTVSSTGLVSFGANGTSSGSLEFFGSTSGNTTLSVNSTGALNFTPTAGQSFSFSDGTNGNSLLISGIGASIANQFTIKGNSTSNPPQLIATGTDSNISINLVPKNSGGLQFNSFSLLDATSSALTLGNNSVSGSVTLAGSSSGSAKITVTSIGNIQYAGTTTNDNAATGGVGEYVSSTILAGSALPLTTNTTINLTSISLTAGDWDVWGTANYVSSYSSAGAINSTQSSIGTTSATLNTANGFWTCQSAFGASTVFAQTPLALTASVGPVRFSLSTTTTVYMPVVSTFTAGSGGTFSVYGILQARRRR